MKLNELRDNQITPRFVQSVMKFANHIASDIAADLPQGPALIQHIRELMGRIYESSNSGSVFLISRAELRDKNILDNLGSVGSHWAWDENSAEVFHHDNARDDAERNGTDPDDLVEILIHAECPARGIDWAYTVATNLIHPSECEITVKNGTRLKLYDVMLTRGRMNIRVPQLAVASGFYNDG